MSSSTQQILAVLSTNSTKNVVQSGKEMPEATADQKKLQLSFTPDPEENLEQQLKNLLSESHSFDNTPLD